MAARILFLFFIALVTGKRKPPRYIRGMRFDKLLLEDEGSGFGDYFSQELDDLEFERADDNQEIFKLNDEDDELPEVSFPVS